MKSSLLLFFACAALLLPAPLRLRAQQPPDLVGPFTVGHQMIDAVDAERDNRPLATLIWYPVDAEDAVGAEPLRYFQHYSGGRWWYESPFVGGVMDAPASSSGPFPLIVLSHGNGGFPQQFAMLGESLASHGFVVAAPRHTGNAWGTPNSPEGSAPMPQDIAFVTEFMAQKAGSQDDVLSGKIDLNTLGLGGYSAGAGAVTRAVTRIPPKAMLAIDLNVGAGVDVPLLAIGGDGGQFPGSLSDGISYGLDLDNVHHWSFGTNGCQYRAKLVEANAPSEVLGVVGSDSSWAGCSSDLRPIDEVQTLVSQQAVSLFKLYLEDDATYQDSLWPSFTELSRDLVVFAELPAGGAGSIDLLLTDPAGRRLGLDLGSGEVINEIGDSARLRGAGSRRQAFSIAAEEILPGDYLITGVGAESLPELRDFQIAYQIQGDRGEDLLSVREVVAAGQIGAGTPVETGFSIVPEPSTNLVVLCCLILLRRRFN